MKNYYPMTIKEIKNLFNETYEIIITHAEEMDEIDLMLHLGHLSAYSLILGPYYMDKNTEIFNKYFYID